MRQCAAVAVQARKDMHVCVVGGHVPLLAGLDTFIPPLHAFNIVEYH
jgi:hypothetical protein